MGASACPESAPRSLPASSLHEPVRAADSNMMSLVAAVAETVCWGGQSGDEFVVVDHLLFLVPFTMTIK
jgi:hypothetical protein